VRNVVHGVCLPRAWIPLDRTTSLEPKQPGRGQKRIWSLLRRLSVAAVDLEGQEVRGAGDAGIPVSDGSFAQRRQLGDPERGVGLDQPFHLVLDRGLVL